MSDSLRLRLTVLAVLLIASTVGGCQEETIGIGYGVYEWGFEAAAPAVVEGSAQEQTIAARLLDSRKYITEIHNVAGNGTAGLSAANVSSFAGEWSEFWFSTAFGEFSARGSMVYERDVTTIFQHAASAAEAAETYDIQLEVVFDPAPVEQAMNRHIRQHDFGAAINSLLAVPEEFEVRGTVSGTLEDEPVAVAFTQRWRVVRHDGSVS